MIGIGLIDELRPSDADGPLLNAVFSTYELALEEPDFFSQDFLPTLFGLGGVRDRGLSAPVSLERRLGESRTVLICDAQAIAAGGRPSLRVDFVAIGEKTHHAKIMLIRRQRCMQLIIASANLTHDGFRRNREVAAVLTFKEERGLPVAILEDAIAAWRNVLPSVPQVLEKIWSDSLAQARKWPGEKLPRESSLRVVFGGGARPLWRELADAWPDGESIEEIQICSPFWPQTGEGESGTTPFEAIVGGLQKKAAMDDCVMTLFAQADSPGEHCLPRFPFKLIEQLKRNDFPIRRGRICPVRLDALEEEVGEGYERGNRALHAKWIVLKGPKTAVGLCGSANFTRRGLGVLSDPTRANIEACVLLKMPVELFDFDAWKVPVAGDGIDWESCTDDDLKPALDEEMESHPWPTFIARLELAIRWNDFPEPQGELRIEFAAPPPPFKLLVAGTENVAYESAAAGNDANPIVGTVRSELVMQLLLRKTFVAVWDGDKRASVPINIAEASLIGMPSILGAQPSEQQLLDYFHGKIDEDDLLALLAEKEKKRANSGSNGGDDIPPAQYQNYLIREFVESLYGMTDNLRRASGSARAFEMAMLGEFSPMKLAERVIAAYRQRKRSPTAAAFQLAEIGRVVAELSWDEKASKLERDTLDGVRARTLDDLGKRIDELMKHERFAGVVTQGDFKDYLRATLKPHRTFVAHFEKQPLQPAIEEPTE